MYSWINRNQFEAHLNKVDMNKEYVEITFRAYFSGTKATIQDDNQLRLVAELKGHKVLVTLAALVQIKGLLEGKAELLSPQDPGGDAALPDGKTPEPL